jgi:hypothetical protein
MEAQLFPRLNVDRNNGPEGSQDSGKHSTPRRIRFAMKKTVLALLLALTLFPAASFAQVVIRIGPPPPVVEVRGVPPERGFVWIDGYHRWDGARYVWVPGRWERPPHPGARWVAHKWVHRHGEWVLIEGHWR